MAKDSSFVSATDLQLKKLSVYHKGEVWSLVTGRVVTLSVAVWNREDVAQTLGGLHQKHGDRKVVGQHIQAQKVNDYQIIQCSPQRWRERRASPWVSSSARPYGNASQSPSGWKERSNSSLHKESAGKGN